MNPKRLGWSTPRPCDTPPRHPRPSARPWAKEPHRGCKKLMANDSLSKMVEHLLRRCFGLVLRPKYLLKRCLDPYRDWFRPTPLLIKSSVQSGDFFFLSIGSGRMDLHALVGLQNFQEMWPEAKPERSVWKAVALEGADVACSKFSLKSIDSSRFRL